MSLRARAVLGLLCVGAAARAAEAPSLTLPEALAWARDHQPSLKSALAELRARRSDARVPRALWLPQLGASAQIIVGTTNNTTTSYLNVPETDLPRLGATRATGTTDWSPSASTLAALTLDQEVFDFGRIAAQAAVTDSLAAVARANVESAGLELQLAVEEAFHAVLAAHAVERATDDAWRRAAAHRDFAQAGVRSGLRPPIELTRAQADVAQLDVRRVRARAGVSEARAVLATTIASDVPEVDAREPAAGEATGPLSMEEALREAAARNPALAAARARLEAQRRLARAIFAEMLPNLFASATLSGRGGGAPPSSGTTPTGDGWLPAVGNWHVGLVLQWNLFDATVLARRAAAQAREAAARADLEVAERAVTLAAERAWIDLDTARRALPALAESVQAAQANHAQADARFRAGLGTTVELADAEALLTNAELELAIGRFAVARARAGLERVLGEPRLALPGGGT
jgi:outer membrane protein TolC